MSAPAKPLRSAGAGVSGPLNRSTGSAVKSASDNDVTVSAGSFRGSAKSFLGRIVPARSMARRLFAAGAPLAYGVRE
jgi:hypothetical protein